MKIYTGFGDRGQTALYGGEKVLKHHPRINVYGTLDELNSTIGLLRSKEISKAADSILHSVQITLFKISSEIATTDIQKVKNKITEKEIYSLEQAIDEFDGKLPALKNFILPGGSETASIAHIARSVCRRAERYLVELMQSTDIRQPILVYLNRLSDLLFVIARYLNMENKIDDIDVIM